MKMSKEIGERVLAVRTNAGLNQRDFAAQLGTSSGGISQIESGKTMPGGDFLLRLHEKFDVDVTYILTGQRTPTSPLSVVPSPPPRPDFNAEEARLLSDFRLCDAHGRSIIKATSRAAAQAARQDAPARSKRRTG